MSEVLELDKFRKPKAKPQRYESNEYYCQRCDSNAFFIRGCGEIRCACCQIPIKNLQAVPK